MSDNERNHLAQHNLFSLREDPHTESLKNC